jgi:hypothetical protein
MKQRGTKVGRVAPRAPQPIDASAIANSDQLTVTMALEMYSDMTRNTPWQKFAAKAYQAWSRLLPYTRKAKGARS